MRAAVVDGRMEAIAGVPDTQIEGDGAVWHDRPDPVGAVTLISAFEIFDQNAAWSVIAGFNTAESGRLSLRTSGAGSSSMQAWMSLSGGTTNTGISVPIRVPGRHVAATRLTADAVQDAWGDDVRGSIGVQRAWGEGISSQDLVGRAISQHESLWVGAWNRALSDVEVFLIMRHLESRYAA